MENTLTEQTEQTEQPKKAKAIKGIKAKEPNITRALPLEEWEQLSEEQITTQKESLLKSLYGKGGEHFSTFPTIIQADKKQNPFIMEYHKGLPNKITGESLLHWSKNNGTIKIIPLIKGSDGKYSYIITLLPNKNLEMETWELRKESKDTIKYTTHTKHKNITLNKNHYHITNIYTNTGKIINQTKLLTKLFNLGLGEYTEYKTFGDNLKNGQYTNPLLWDINSKGEWVFKELGKNNNQPTGKTFYTLGEYLGRELHSLYKEMDLTKLIN